MNEKRTPSPKRSVHGRIALTAFAAAVLLSALAFLPASSLAALATTPSVSESSLSAITETSATMTATLAPNGKKTNYSFQYLTEADYQRDGESFGEGTHVVAEGEIAEGLEESHPLSAAVTGLTPATAYRARLFAENSKGPANAEALPFATYSTTPAFAGACPGNEAFREPGTPSATLSDCRAYEQVSPVDKNGLDTTGTIENAKAAADGSRVTFAAFSPIPGAEGADAFTPLNLASRGGAGWSSAGVLPPLSYGQVGRLAGWTPDLSHLFTWASTFKEPTNQERTTVFLDRSSADGSLRTVVPHTDELGEPGFAGSAEGGRVVVFENERGPLETNPAGVARGSNVYAWDRETGSLHLASVMNDEAPPPHGAFAGPYDWVRGSTINGGAGQAYYTQDERAVSEDGSVFFTSANDASLYLREHPTAPQSNMAGGECTQEDNACTIEVSASHRTAPDQAGPAPAAFQVASADGDTAFFTSSQKLTDDANTGPEVEAPRIGRATIGAPPEEEAEEPLPELLKDHHAVGIAISAEHLYWADPLVGTIGSAKLNGSGPPTEVEEIEPGETCFETHPHTEPGVIHCAPSTPRYIAVANGHVYWTNTGPLGGDINLGGVFSPAPTEVPIFGAGTIGRAALDGSGDLVRGSVEPEFITGASDPEGIAVNSEQAYWANSLERSCQLDSCIPPDNSIARAGAEGEAVQQDFIDYNGTSEAPAGVALDQTHVYWDLNFNGGGSELVRVPLGGGEKEEFLISNNTGEIAGLALHGSYIYAAEPLNRAIGRVATSGLGATNRNCEAAPASCDPEFIKLSGIPTGLATDAESHIFWSANGEIPPHPGNDLYRFQSEGTSGCQEADGCLADLTPDSTDLDGAEVKGVLGTSLDGSTLYFVANAVLAANQGPNGETAGPGSCQGPPGPGALSGTCNLYLWREGATHFIARLDAGAGGAQNWLWQARDASGNKVPKTSRLSADGQTLLFLSSRQLTAYPSERTPELYRYRDGAGISCVSCNPTGTPPSAAPLLGSISSAGMRSNSPSQILSRNLSADGNRAFFESPEALVSADHNGVQDIYEWEAPSAGSCTQGGPAFSLINEGCLYLISTGTSPEPSYLADASASGDDVFFFTRSQLVGQDRDDLVDVYDAHRLGGLTSQYPPAAPIPCEAEGCMPGQSAAPQAPTPSTAGFQGPGNVKETPARRCPKGRRTARRHGKVHCLGKELKHRHRHQRRRHNRRKGARR
jgi:hypothetical protein